MREFSDICGTIVGTLILISVLLVTFFIFSWFFDIADKDPAPCYALGIAYKAPVRAHRVWCEILVDGKFSGVQYLGDDLSPYVLIDGRLIPIKQAFAK